MRIDLEAVQAIIRASSLAYGSGKVALTQDADGRRRFIVEDDWSRLIDEFDGGDPFCGIVRVVRKSDNAAIWNNYYHGWLTDEAARQGLSNETVFNFMRQALQHPDPDTISRDPKAYEDKSFSYINKLEAGDPSRFYGQDMIYIRGSEVPVYMCRYGGGLVNLSDDAGEVATS